MIPRPVSRRKPKEYTKDGIEIITKMEVVGIVGSAHGTQYYEKLKEVQYLKCECCDGKGLLPLP